MDGLLDLFKCNRFVLVVKEKSKNRTGPLVVCRADWWRGGLYYHDWEFGRTLCQYFFPSRTATQKRFYRYHRLDVFLNQYLQTALSYLCLGDRHTYYLDTRSVLIARGNIGFCTGLKTGPGHPRRPISADDFGAYGPGSIADAVRVGRPLW